MTEAVNVNFRMEKSLKNSMEKVCADMGLTMTAAFTVFAKTVSREKRIPFEITADPFYSESNRLFSNKGFVFENGKWGIPKDIIPKKLQKLIDEYGKEKIKEMLS